MKFRQVVGVLCLAFAGAAQATLESGTPPSPEVTPTQEQSRAAHLTAEVLARYHYKAMPLDDAMSEKISDHYLKALDPEKVFFVQNDIAELAGTKLGNAILHEDLSVPFHIFNLFTHRVSERFAYARSLLKTSFDFSQQESYQLDRTTAAWPKSESEMEELWRKRVKNDWLRLKLAGKDQKSIAETLDRRYDNSMKRLSRVKSEDAFQIFMNAYTTAFDPHTNYMGPRAAENFDIAMKLSLVGIGASLEEKNDYITIRELVPGGPAALSGKLKVGDRIVGVAQGKGGAMADIVGLRPDDAVALIRGAADSQVELDVLPAGAGPDGQHKRVALIRKKITLEDQSAKKSIITVAGANVTRRIGVVSLPMFYEDFEARQRRDPDFKSATRDVARLLGELKKEKVDGVLIDLRNNGGGSLTEAIDLTGLFIGKGPVVQQRNAKGEIEVASSTKAGVAWSGPLGVLINRGSASASEIFAAAIQDYGRGLVIGERSFGKGTVQTVVDLDQLAKNDKPKFGELKFTIAQFFRINGGTTQLRGVTPDISLPAITDPDDFREAGFDNALPWMQIKAADYSPAGELKELEPALLARHDARVKTDKGFLCLQQDIATFDRQRKKNMITLNEAERRRDRDVREAQSASCDLRRGAVAQKASEDDGLQSDERSLAAELSNEKASKDAKDVLLNESAQILSDETALLGTVRFASRGKTDPRLLPDQRHATDAADTRIW